MRQESFHQANFRQGEREEKASSRESWRSVWAFWDHVLRAAESSWSVDWGMVERDNFWSSICWTLIAHVAVDTMWWIRSEIEGFRGYSREVPAVSQLDIDSMLDW